MHGLNFLNAAFFAQVLAFSFEHASAQRSPLTGSEVKYNILRPVDEFHPTLGRRALPEDKLDIKNLEPSNELMLQWAAQNEDGTLLHAKMDLNSDDGTKLLFMSRFQGFTTSVDCSIRDNDGLSIVFKTAEYLELAKKQWGWLTEDEGNSFWMITNHKDCSKDDDPLDEFVPYLITDVDYTDDLTVEFVHCERKTFEDALKVFSYQFEWGHYSGNETQATAAPGSASEQGNQKRGWWDEFKEKVTEEVTEIKEEIVEAVSYDADKDVQLDLTWGTPGERSRLGESILPAEKELYCVDCYLQGQIKLGGRVRGTPVSIDEASFYIQPQDVKLMLKFNAKFQPSDRSTTVIPLYHQVPPGFEIPYVFKLGPEISLDLEFSSEVKEEMDFEFGLEAGFPNEAKVSNDIMNWKDVTFEGWEKTHAGPLPFDLKSGAVDVQLEAGPTLSVGFVVEGFLVGGFEAAVKAPIGHWKGGFVSFMDEAGACEQTEEANKIGVQIDQSIKTGIRFYAGPTGSMQDKFEPLVDQELWSMEQQLDSECKGIASYADDPEYKELEKELMRLEEEQAGLDKELEDLDAELAGNPSSPVESGTAPVESGIAPVASGIAPVASGIAPVDDGSKNATGWLVDWIERTGKFKEMAEGVKVAEVAAAPQA